ncbi:MAG: aminotransferase class IV [Halobacteriovoraceae bacterium]|nr:aminotransferase class IV [Halobacteriovoraceae bacterium]MCB9093919.1 aminotransferase class IV [Halobacteriovoraceae bacterium]
MPFEKNCLVNINGTVCKPEEANINIFDRGFLFGDSIYEATLCQENIPLFMQEHYDRLLNTAEIVHTPVPYSLEKIIEEFKKITSQKTFSQAILRVIITRGIDYLNIFPSGETEPNLILIYKELKGYPQLWYEKGISIKVANIKRNHPKTTDPRAKTGNYLNSVLAALEAKNEGYDDAIFLNLDGNITEGTTNNFWIVKGQTVLTPSLDSGILSGITRMKVIEICKKHNIAIQETHLKESDLSEADESFITSSTKGIVPVTQINRDPIGSGMIGEITKLLTNHYNKLVRDYTNSN